MQTIDLYTQNYLGELETTLIQKNSSNQIVYELRLFSADFNSIIEWLPFNQNSHTESVVYLYNMNLDWGINYTLITRLQEFYNQLMSITNQVHSLDLPILDALKQICQSALQNGNRLFIKQNH